MSEHDDNVVRTIVRDLRDMAQLTLAILGDDDAAAQLLGAPVDTAAANQAASGALAALDQFTQGEAKLVELGTAAERMVELGQLLRVTAQSPQGEVPEDLLEEIAGTLVDTAALTYLDTHLPSVFTWAKVLGFVGEQVNWDRLWALLRDGFSYLKDQVGELEDEEDARRHSLALALIAATAAFVRIKSREREEELGGVSEEGADLEVLHGFEPDPTSTAIEADALSERMLSIALRYERGDVDAALIATTALVPRSDGGPGLWISLAGEADTELALGDGWYLVAEGAIEDGVDAFLGFPSAEHDSFVRVGAAVGGGVDLRLERREEPQPGVPAQPWNLGGFVQVKEASFALRLADSGPFALMRLRDATLSIDPPDRAPFREALPSGVRADFDLGVGVDRDGKLFFEGGGGLRALVPLSVRLGAVHVQHVLARVEPEEGTERLAVEVGLGLALRTPSLTIAADGLGVAVTVDMSEGTTDRFDAEQLLPSAIGVAVDVDFAKGGFVKGGGFLAFDRDRGRWGGVLELAVHLKWFKATVKAFGLMTERPQGGHSFIVVLSAEFPKPVPSGPGLRLEGVGGLLGWGHGVDPAALQEGLRGGALDRLLFPDDPVAAGPQILNTLGVVFPQAQGQHVAGPMFKLSWGARRLTTLAVAVVVEWPDPTRVLVLGELESSLPRPDHALVLFHAEFAMVIDLDSDSLAIDAALSKSRVGNWPLTGDLAVRIGGGEDDQDSVFLITAGGFHPKFAVPENVTLPQLRRISLALTEGKNPRARVDMYFAITAGTVQLGGKLDVYAAAGGFSAEAVLGFDVLVRWEPDLYFEVSIVGRAAIRYGGAPFCGVGLHLEVTGPGRWTVDGKATVDLFLFSVSIPIRGSFGSAAEGEAPLLADAVGPLRAALEEPASWEVGVPEAADAFVSLAGVPAGEGAVPAHPLGRIALRQYVVPFGVDVTRVGGARTVPDRFTVERVTVAGADGAPRELRSSFAVGQFVELTDDERLGRPEFEPLVSGFEVPPAGPAHAPSVAADLGYEEIVLGPDGPLADPVRGRPGLVKVIVHAALLGAAGTTLLRRDEEPSRLRATAPGVRLQRPAAVIADSRTLSAAAGARTVTEAIQALARHGDVDELVVVERHEAVPVG